MGELSMKNIDLSLLFIFSAIIMGVIYYISLICFCGNRTERILSNLNSKDSLNNIMNHLFQEMPVVSIDCICYHYKTVNTTYTDYQGNKHTVSDVRQVISHTESQKLNIFSYLDISGIFHLKETNKNFILLELGK